MHTLELEFLVEIIAKALCFEHYITLLHLEDPNDVDVTHALNFYEENCETYLEKAQELLFMAENSKELLNNTFH